MPKGLTAARRAVSLDPDLGEAHAALAMARLLWEWDAGAARAEFERCLELNPQYTQGRCWYGAFYLSWLSGRTAEGVAEARRALEVDPLSNYAAILLAMCLFCDGQHRESLEFARRAVEREPDSLINQWVHQLAAQLNDLQDESIAAAEKAFAVSGGHPYPLAHLVAGLVQFGRMPEARAAYARLLDLAAGKYVPGSALAIAAAAMGEQDKAIEWVLQSCDEREGALIIYSQVFPNAERLRSDPRFGEVTRRLRR
jgi:tetratricopeptide (TPR) repeat protein